MTERHPTLSETNTSDIQRQTLEAQIQRIERLTEPESPLAILGNIALSSLVGGAITGGTVMPRTEAVTLELIVGATEYSDALQLEKRAA